MVAQVDEDEHVSQDAPRTGRPELVNPNTKDLHPGGHLIPEAVSEESLVVLPALYLEGKFTNG